MYLKALELAGFKSFAKKETLEFKSSITAIVGPNGSGKSNMAEAFRFVLGEQSLKSMRGKRGEDLIWNGSKLTPKGNRGSVKVIFDNKNRLLNIDHEEVVFERVVHRDGANEYFLNGSSVRLKDITELLAYANIGATGHHIISQGEADRILSANARERREMIEDALGLKVYQYKRIESEKKLLKTKENIASVQSLRREIAPHIKFLKKQMEKIERTKEMREKLVLLYAEYLKRESLYLQHEKTQIETVLAPLQERKNDLQKTISEVKKQLEEEKNESRESTDMLAIEEGLRAVRAKKEETAKEIGRIEGEIAVLTREHEKTMREFESGGGMVSFEEVRVLSESIRGLTDEVETVHDVDSAKSIISRIRNAVVTFFEKFEHTERKREADIAFSKTLTIVSEKKEALNTHLENLAQEEKNLIADLEVLKNKIAESQNTNRDAERMLFESMTLLNDVEREISDAQLRRSILAKDTGEFERELQEGAVLVGRDIQKYAEYSISIEDIVAEERTLQEERKRELEKVKIRIEDSGLGDTKDTEQEYSEAVERDEFLAKEIDDLEKSAESLSVLISELMEKIDIEFKAGVHKINTAFNDFFMLMFGGGRAGLQTVIQKKKRKQKSELDEVFSDENNDEDKDDVGIEVDVALPHKRTKGLMMLSGGERALTSIALLFAISQVNPPPFIILDETDAALDEANSRKYGDMIENLSKHSQLILITHNRETMSRAGILYGVTMGGDGASKILSVKLEDAVVNAK